MTDLLHTLPNFPTKLYTHLIPSLERKLITTTDLLTLEPLEIARRAQLPLLDVRRLTRHVLARLQSQLGVLSEERVLREYEGHLGITDTSSLSRNGSAIVTKWSVISTLDPILDNALSGGIPTGYITEVTGERFSFLFSLHFDVVLTKHRLSGAGKTQFLLSLLITAQLPPPYGLSRPTVYISTEHPLPTPRLTQILRTHTQLSSLTPLQKPSLSRIFSIQTPDLESQDHILAYQVPVLLARHNAGLIVIDSIAANYRAERSSTSSSGAALGLRTSQLLKLGHQLRSLAREHDCAIVVSNQVADRFAPTSPSPPQTRQTSASPPHFLSSSPHGSSQGMQSLDAAIMPPPPPSNPLPQPYQSLSIYPPLTLDHQQNFFTGWSSAPPPSLHHEQTPQSASQRSMQNQNSKTPALGLVWTNQIACRIALVKKRNLGLGGEGTSSTGDGERLWRRYMKIAFASWGPGTGSMGKGIEFEIWGGGVRSLVMKPEGEE
ncbi:MAG: hypothetical protein L6R35_000014 [Caloplaca aegaea]|nr:MAG: hypothetical protein L6R35_000014 [Caloplaca aegaea]